ncbi:MAG: metallophosphoesterase [Cyanobacteria bacterium RYN_339]|nr:metallophosphoesterase [Cyanobacteria bacterium RYN_339]
MITLGDRWGFRTRRVTIPIKGLAAPLRVLHLSDLHLCAHDRAKATFIRKTTDADYDFVFLTGDIAEEEAAEALVPGLLTRTPRYGAFAVLGNHDHWRMSTGDHLWEFLGGTSRNRTTWTEVLPMKARYEADDRWRVLINEHVQLEINGQRVVIAGIDDPFTRRGDLHKTMQGVKQADVLIGLVHVPTDLASLSQRGFHLVLAGHTHGGQVRLPFIGALRTQCDLPTRHAAGLHHVERTAVHVSQGLGAGRLIRVRLFCPPTAYDITLEPVSQR